MALGARIYKLHTTHNGNVLNDLQQEAWWHTCMTFRPHTLKEQLRSIQSKRIIGTAMLSLETTSCYISLQRIVQVLWGDLFHCCYEEVLAGPCHVKAERVVPRQQEHPH